MKKVLFVATVVKTHIMEFHIPYLKMFKEMGWETAVAARNDYENPQDCVIPYCDKYYDIPFERFPIKPGNLTAYKSLKKVIDGGGYDIIHCHTPVGAMLTRLAAQKARRNGTRVIYTAHGFHFYKGAPLVNWLVYYPVEKVLAHMTDVLITINKEDYARAQKFGAKKVCYVPGVGIDTKKFLSEDKRQKEDLRSKLKINSGAFVILSVGEINKNKNHRVVIEAFAKLNIPNAYYVVCGKGPLIEEYKQLASSLGVANRVIFTGYRTDVADFYKIADVFVFPSFREGLPVAIMEAMAGGLPVICSKIRGNSDLITEGENGLFINPNDCNSIVNAINNVRLLMSEKNIKSVNIESAKKFSVDMLIEQYKDIYEI